MSIELYMSLATSLDPSPPLPEGEGSVERNQLSSGFVIQQRACAPSVVCVAIAAIFSLGILTAACALNNAPYLALGPSSALRRAPFTGCDREGAH